MHRFILALLLSLVPACVGTPQPNPPALDPSRLMSGGRAATVAGGPGAVSPPGAELRITPLDTMDDPLAVVPDADGSFEVVLAEGRHRLSPRLDALRGEPVDVEVSAAGVAVLAPLAPCLQVPKESEALPTRLGETSELVVPITNGCADAVSVRAAVRRAGDYEVVGSLVNAAPGETLELRVRFAPTAEGLREEVLLLDVSGPAPERRWVTVFGAGTR